MPWRGRHIEGYIAHALAMLLQKLAPGIGLIRIARAKDLQSNAAFKMVNEEILLDERVGAAMRIGRHVLPQRRLELFGLDAENVRPAALRLFKIPHRDADLLDLRGTNSHV